MSEPTSLALTLCGVTSTAVYGGVAWLARRLPRWRSRRIEYRVVDYTAVKLWGDLWLVTVDGTTYYTSQLHAMREFLDRLEMSDQAAQRVP